MKDEITIQKQIKQYQLWQISKTHVHL